MSFFGFPSIFTQFVLCFFIMHSQLVDNQLHFSPIFGITQEEVYILHPNFRG